MKTKVRSAVILIVCFVLIAFFAFASFNGFKIGSGANEYEFKSFDKLITKGLDLQGGVSVLMEIQADKVTENDRNVMKELISLRVNSNGAAETVVTKEGDKGIRVDIPGQYDSSKIVDSLSKSGNLTFKDPNGNVVLTGKDVKKANTYTDSTTGKPVVGLELNDSGKKKFADATTKFVGQKISIYMDDKEVSSPTVDEPITGGSAKISYQTMEQAKTDANIINAGSFPYPVKAASVKTVGAQLGENALPNALLAGALALVIIFTFIILFYRVPGVLACLALTLYTVLVLYIFKGVNATLTLPGIAAFILTIGTAIDANILIFERMREELKAGKSIATSVKLGFDHAMASIIDANLTSIICALILYFLGTGPVKGFALTLLIGTVTSLFTAIVVTKFFIKLALSAGWLKKPSYFRVKRG